MTNNMEQPALTALIILFTDLEGSTRLWQQFPQAMQTALARHDAIISSAVEEHDGRIVKTTGDGFYAVFDSAADGLMACISAQRGLLHEPWAETGPLRVRMGLHRGEVQARGDDFFGTAVNRTARLMSAANGGQVLLSAAAAAALAGLLPQDVSLRDLGQHRLKDLLRPEHVFQLVHAQLPADFPAIASLNRQPNNLPSQPSAFVGRQAELGEIKERLSSDTVRLLTLTGPGGTGKTRLALQTGADLSDRFLDGTYFIDLAPIRDPEAVLVSIARTIGLSESKNGSMLDELKEQLGDKRILLLLDNFEQVTAAGRQMANLLQYCPRLKLLVTSREALRVRGEHIYPVPPLGVPQMNGRRLSPQELAGYEAVQLFVDRAQAVKPGFVLTADNARAVAELCLRLDGLPLAIELAAARIRMFSPQALAQRLGNRLKLLRGGARDLPQRQQTLRDTIGWSYELLSAPEQTLFAVLSVFKSGTFEAAEAVAEAVAVKTSAFDGADFDIFEGLESQVDKSLIRLVDDGTAEPRLRMLETIREYAAERLKKDGGLEQAACSEHAAYFANFAQEQRGRLSGYDRQEAEAALAADVENLQIAWQYWTAEGDLEQLQKMVDSLWLLYERSGWYQAMADLTSDLLDVLATTPSTPEHAHQEIMLRTTLARALMAVRGFTPEVEKTFQQALALSEGQGEIPQLFPVLRGLSMYYQFRSEFERAAEMGERILALAESSDDDFMRIHAYLVIGSNLGFITSLENGLAYLDKGIALFDPDQQRLRPFQIGNNPGIVCYTASAFFLLWSGKAEQAFERAQKAVDLATRLNHPYSKTYALFHAGILYLWSGEVQRAKENALAMAEIATAQEYHLWSALALILLGAAESSLGQTEEGLAKLEKGFAAYMGHITPPVFWPMIMSLRAAAYGRARRESEGVSMLDELLGDKSALPDMLLLKGDLLLAQSPANAPEAVALFQQVLGVTQMIGARLWSLQAAIRLCKLAQLQGNGEEGCRLLSELYTGFTEGFETADLREAKALLDEAPL